MIDNSDIDRIALRCGAYGMVANQWMSEHDEIVRMCKKYKYSEFMRMLMGVPIYPDM